VLTGGTYKGCSDDVLVESKLMFDLVEVELDTMDILTLFPGNIWLGARREKMCHRLVNTTDLMHGEHVAEKVHGERR
jgi:hypothetical protein